MSLSPEQLAYRRNSLGSSDLAAILNLNNYRKPIDVFADKRGLTEPQPESPAMRAGTRIEPITAGYFAEATGATLLTGPEYAVTQGGRFGNGAALGIFTHPEHSYFTASPDRIAVFKDTDAIVELKFARARNAGKWGESGSDEYPVEYLCQVQWQLFVAGMAQAFLAVLIGGEDFRYYSIARDDELIGMMADKAHDFWNNHVVPGTPPSTVDDSPAWRQIAKAPQKGKAIQPTPEIEQLRREYLAADDAVKSATATLETVKNKITLAMGDAEKVVNDEWPKPITNFERKGRTSTDWEGLVKELAVPDETLTRFQRTGKPSRVLTVR